MSTITYSATGKKKTFLFKNEQIEDYRGFFLCHSYNRKNETQINV